MRFDRIVPGEWRNKMGSALASSSADNLRIMFTANPTGEVTATTIQVRLICRLFRFAPIGDEIVFAFRAADLLAQEGAAGLARVRAVWTDDMKSRHVAIYRVNIRPRRQPAELNVIRLQQHQLIG